MEWSTQSCRNPSTWTTCCWWWSNWLSHSRGASKALRRLNVETCQPHLAEDHQCLPSSSARGSNFCLRSDGQVGQKGMRVRVGGQQDAEAPEERGAALECASDGNQAALHALVARGQR